LTFGFIAVAWTAQAENNSERFRLDSDFEKWAETYRYVRRLESVNDRELKVLTANGNGPIWKIVLTLVKIRVYNQFNAFPKESGLADCCGSLLALCTLIFLQAGFCKHGGKRRLSCADHADRMKRLRPVASLACLQEDVKPILDPNGWLSLKNFPCLRSGMPVLVGIYVNKVFDKR
jgi:hypothetical protein